MAQLTDAEHADLKRFRKQVDAAETYSLNEARVEAMRRMCVETAQHATTVEELRRVVVLMLERDRW